MVPVNIRLDILFATPRNALFIKLGKVFKKCICWCSDQYIDTIMHGATIKNKYIYSVDNFHHLVLRTDKDV